MSQSVLVTRPSASQNALVTRPNAVAGGGGGGTTYVGSDTFSAVGSGAITDTNQPAAVTELFGATNRRFAKDTTGRNEARVQVGGGTSGLAGSKYALQVSTDGGGSWLYVDGVSGPNVACDNLGSAVSTTVGAWVTMAPGAIGDFLYRFVSLGGNGVIDPTIGNLEAEFRTV